VSFGFPAKELASFADPYSVTTFLARRRRPATPQRYLVSVSDRWALVGGQFRREVLVRQPGGPLVVEHLADEHPALVSFLDRAAVAA
jgi:hypothetical protein